jgi:outer membrane protein TolC
MSLVGRSIFCITMLMILLGCAAVGPDYRAPEAQTQAGFTYAAQPGLSNDAVEVAWWRSFQDPLLTRFIETALSANHDLRIATANLREARALRLETVFERYPIITSGASYNNVQSSEASTPGGPAPIGISSSTTSGLMPCGSWISSVACAARSRPAPQRSRRWMRTAAT